MRTSLSKCKIIYKIQKLQNICQFKQGVYKNSIINRW